MAHKCTPTGCTIVEENAPELLELAKKQVARYVSPDDELYPLAVAQLMETAQAWISMLHAIDTAAIEVNKFRNATRNLRRN